MKKAKILSMLIFTIFIYVFAFGIRVKALDLVETPIDDVWYFRKGGGKPAFSAQFKYYNIDNKTTYCIEPGEHITTNNYEDIGIMSSPYNEETTKLIGLIGYYGYDYPGHDTLRYRMATQALIWEKTGGQVVEYWTKPSGDGTYINIDAEKGEIMNLVNNHTSLPSFVNKKLTGYTNNAVTFTDNYNNLYAFRVIDSENYTSSIEGNVLTIYPKKLGLIEVNLIRDGYTNNMTTLFAGINSNSQMMGYFGLTQDDMFKVYVNSKGGYINLNKVDSKTFTSVPRGDGKLEGAIYAVYDSNGNEVDRITIDSNCTGKSKELPLGSYTVKEIVPSLGYALDTSSYSITISKSNLNPNKKVLEWIKSSHLEILKVKNDKNTGVLSPEEGIEFDIYLKSSGEKMVVAITDQDGYTNAVLPYGLYVIKQVNTTPGYKKMDDYEIFVSENTYIRKVFSDGKFDGSKLKVNLKDLETNNIINYDNIKFKIKNLDTNEYVCQNINYPDNKTICEFETKNGIFTTPNNLDLGNYELEQIDQIIDNYLWNNNKILFTIDENSTDLVELDFYNEPVKGKIELTKYGEELIINDNNYNYNNVLLDNVKFELYANEDIYYDNNLIYKKDDLVKSFKTKEGIYKLDNLYLGSYYLKEINNDLKYNPINNICFDIMYKDQYTKEILVEIQLTNTLKKGIFELTKLDKETNEIIPNTIYEFYNDKNELIFRGSTNELGKIVLNDLAYGEYTYKEITPNDDYLLDNTVYSFKIENDKELISNTLYNEKIKEEEIITEEALALNEEEIKEEPIIEENTNELEEENDIIQEIIDVPITDSNEIDKITLLGILLIIVGIFNIYENKKEN